MSENLMTTTSPEGPPSGDVFIGLDGARGGWAGVVLDREGRWQVGLWPDLASLWAAHQNAARILVDMPMGLPGPGSQGEGLAVRECDRLARKLLGPRRGSVFSPPCRAALETDDYQEALRLNREHTGRGISIQAFHIRGKILEADRLLLRDEAAREGLLEAHPELSFAALNGGPVMAHAKRTKEGRSERLEALGLQEGRADREQAVFESAGPRQVMHEGAVGAERCAERAVVDQLTAHGSGRRPAAPVLSHGHGAATPTGTNPGQRGSVLYPPLDPAMLQPMSTIPRRLAAPDDWLDALALAVCAMNFHLTPVPDPPEIDGNGLAMAIWVPEMILGGGHGG